MEAFRGREQVASPLSLAQPEQLYFSLFWKYMIYFEEKGLLLKKENLESHKEWNRSGTGKVVLSGLKS